MSGGNFFNRGRIIKADGEPLALADLIPGDTIRILGQEVTITDADGFTRDFVRFVLSCLVLRVEFQNIVINKVYKKTIF